jgi:hypothetical protein
MEVMNGIWCWFLSGETGAVLNFDPYPSNLNPIWQFFFNSRPNLNQSSVVTVYTGGFPNIDVKKPWENHGKRTRIHAAGG